MSIFDMIPAISGYKTAIGGYGLFLGGLGSILIVIGSLLTGHMSVSDFAIQIHAMWPSFVAAFFGLSILGIGHKLEKHTAAILQAATPPPVATIKA